MTEGKILAEAVICPNCDHVDDLVPHPKTGASRRCPCPHDEVTVHQRQREVELRHREAVARARQTLRWARMRSAS